MKTKQLLLLGATLLTLAGCAGYGPTDKSELDRALVESVPKSEGRVQFSGAAVWWPDTNGYTSLRNLASTVQGFEGALAITDQAVLFQQWDSKNNRFNIMKKIAFAEVRDASLDELGVSRSLVIRSKEYQYDTFTFVQPGGLINDPAKVIAAQKYLAGVLAK